MQYSLSLRDHENYQRQYTSCCIFIHKFYTIYITIGRVMKTKTGLKQIYYRTLAVLVTLFLCVIISVPRITHAAPSITEYDLPTIGSQPISITTGPDGNVWFVTIFGNTVGRITDNGTITEYPVPTPSAGLQDITTGPDGNLWFTEGSSNKIGRITLSGTITEFAIPTSGASPTGITAGPDGNVWFTELLGDTIGRITPSGVITEFPLPTASSNPRFITTGPDNNLWFTEAGSNKIGKITPTGTLTEFTIPTPNTQPYGITTGPDGNLWFTEFTVGQIGRITPGGTITEFSLNPTGLVFDITTGPDGNLWFNKVEGSDSKIVQMKPDGTVLNEFLVPTSSAFSAGITKGPNNTIWFTEVLTNKIGVIRGIPVDNGSSGNGGAGEQQKPLVPTAPDTGVNLQQRTVSFGAIGLLICALGAGAILSGLHIARRSKRCL
jgi:virginiamycin B lyase